MSRAKSEYQNIFIPNFINLIEYINGGFDMGL